MLKVIGREVLREKTPTIQDLEQSLQIYQRGNNMNKEDGPGNKETKGLETDIKGNGIPVPGPLLLRS